MLKHAGFELAGEDLGFGEFVQEAVKEGGEAALVGEEGSELEFEAILIFFLLFEDEALVGRGIGVGDEFDGTDGHAVPVGGQGEVGFIAGELVFFEVVEAANVLADVAADGALQEPDVLGGGLGLGREGQRQTERRKQSEVWKKRRPSRFFSFASGSTTA